MAQQQEVDFKFSFAPFKDFVPFTGEQSDMIPEDGIGLATITGFRPYFSKAKPGEQPKPMLSLAATIQDADFKGLRLVDQVLCGGLDKHNEDLGRQLVEVLVATGITSDQIHGMAQDARFQDMSIRQIAQAYLMGKTVVVEWEADSYEGRPTSSVRRWQADLTMPERQARLQQQQVLKAHRRPRRAVQSTAATQAAAGAFNVGGAAPGPGAMPLPGAMATVSVAGNSMGAPAGVQLPKIPV